LQERPFLDISSQPTEQAIQATLGRMYACYEKMMGLTSSYLREWTFTKSSGWMLKVSAHKKALFYLIPLNNGFKISLAIRDKERESFLGNDELGIMHEQLSSSKKYVEGFALQFEIADKKSGQQLELFIRKLIAIRA